MIAASVPSQLARTGIHQLPAPIHIELINTGSELMLGRVLNTHQQWLCRRLSDRGYLVERQVAVPDAAGAIQCAVRESLSRSDLVLTTGGLGPTSDDLTRHVIAELLGRRLFEDAAVVRHIEQFFAAHCRPMPEATRVQALVPERALVLANAHGTAPGLAMRVDPNPFRERGECSWLIMLPGPPRELRPMMDSQVIPLLLEQFPLQERFVSRTLKTTGLGESAIEEKLAEILRPYVEAGLELGYCARVGEVEVRLAARGAAGEQLVQTAEHAVRQRIGREIFGVEDDTLERVIVRRLIDLRKTLVVAESCTGGFLAHRITNVPGASEIFNAGLVAYSNAAKQQLLGVRPETLEAHGAVSDPVAREMALGALLTGNADYALALTGIAGPTGGTPEKPVGTVFIGFANAGGAQAVHFVNAYDRETFKFVSSQQALNLLRHRLDSCP